jgi:glycosyltransferase involved in cell wall biosynthesis
VLHYNNDVKSLPATDLAIATLWTTAYFVSDYSAAKKKAYFIQDDETLFYAPGSTTALVEASYQLGLLGITNTFGLQKMYEERYKGTALTLKSSLDLTKYLNTEVKIITKKPFLVFFYARPNHPRNGFELGIAALKKLKEYYGDDVRIVTAGADWEPNTYGLGNVVSNLGKLSIEELPNFYKQLDSALFLMFSKHPGVVPSELMASGCPVVVNSSTDETWNSLYRNNETAVVCLPTATEIFKGLKKALTDQGLRKQIIPAARETVVEYYSNYEKEADRLLRKIENSEY